MFSFEADASKIALVNLVKHLQHWGYKLIDCQVTSEHLESLGAVEISREQFRLELQRLLGQNGKDAPWKLTLETTDTAKAS